MVRRPRLLDLFCGAGGAAMGYHLAGFDIVGVDNKPQPHYPFEFLLGDAMSVLNAWDWIRTEFDVVHASPPCQAYTKAKKLQGNEHPDLVRPVRERLVAIGLPYVIENVPGAPLLNPTVLCGAMFDLGVYRHRLFETSFELPFMLHGHGRRQAKMGRPPRDGDVIQVVGHVSNVPYARRAMGIDWMTQTELAQAIPPAYTKMVGRFLIEQVRPCPCGHSPEWHRHPNDLSSCPCGCSAPPSVVAAAAPASHSDHGATP